MATMRLSLYLILFGLASTVIVHSYGDHCQSSYHHSSSIYTQNETVLDHSLLFTSYYYVGKINRMAPVGSDVQFTTQRVGIYRPYCQQNPIVYQIDNDIDGLWLVNSRCINDNFSQLIIRSRSSLEHYRQNIQATNSPFITVTRNNQANLNYRHNIYTIVAFDKRNNSKNQNRLHANLHLGYSQILVQIVDERNRHPPQFQQSLYTRIIYSNTPIGTPVVQVQAVDKDSGLNGQVMYRLLSDNRYFAINFITGFVYIINKLDIKHARQVFQLEVEAQDRGQIPYRSQTHVTIDVINVTSYHPPQIKIIKVWPLPTPAVTSTRVAKIYVRDGDHGRYGTIVNVAIQVINDNRDLFSLQRIKNHHQYYVALKRPFQQEEQQSTPGQNQFYLRIIASDNGRPALTSQLNFAVPIIPKIRQIFSEDSYQFRILDCAPPGIQIDRLSAIGQTTSVIYAIRSGNEEGIFTISSQHGILYTKDNLLTYQQRQRYQLEVWGYRSFNEIYRVTVLILVIPVNRYVPQFRPLPPSTLTLPNMQQIGRNYPIIQIRAQSYHPPFLNTTQDILYTIANNQSLPFSIGPHSGLLTLNQQINETQCRQLHGIPLIVRALDQANPYLYQSQVTITLVCQSDNITLPSANSSTNRIVSSYQLDSNRYAPQFRQQNQNKFILKLNRNAAPSSRRPIYTFYATDGDEGLDGLVMYVLSDGSQYGLFSLDYISGQLKLIESLNSTTLTTFQLTVAAYDAGLRRRSTETTLQIQITESKDHNSIVYNSTTVFILQITSYVPAGFKITNITDSFSLQGNISYSLLTYTHYFQLDKKNGILTTLVETPTILQSKFLLVILIQNNSQNGDITYRQIAIIRSPRINLYKPQFDRPNYRIWLPNDIPVNSYITRIHAVDNDVGESGEIRYAPTRGGHRKWVVNRITGTIYLGTSLTQPYQYQQQSFLWRYFHFLIRAKDRSDMSKVDQCYVDIAVAPRLPIQPQFSSGQVQVNITENVTIGTFIVDISRYLQPQLIENAGRPHYTYKIISGNGLEYFHINSVTGNITNLKLFDYDVQAQFWLTVQATDETTLPLQWNQLLIVINIININDHPPLPQRAIYYQTIEENSPVGYEVMQISVNDKDCQSRSSRRITPLCTLQFYIIKGNEDQYFYIGVSTGRLAVAKTPQLGQNSEDFMLTVSISDGQWQSRVRVRIHVIRQQKAIIAFTEDHYKVDIIAQSFTRLSNFMLRVLALNRYNPTQRFYYTLLDHQSGKFTIESQTGIIQCNENLNQQNQYTLTVAAEEYPNGTYSLPRVITNKSNPSSIATIRVRSIGPSQVAPIPHFCDNYPITLNENLQIMTVIWYPKITSVNRTQLNYWIHKRNDNYTFIISTDTGLIRLAHPLRYDRQHHYTLHVSTTNGYQVAKCQIEVIVRNVNHYWPRFQQHDYSAVISPTTPVRYAILTVTATDDDLTETVTYTLDDHTSNIVREYFDIEKNTGRIILAKEILPNQYNRQFVFNVLATDNGQPEHKDVTRISILIQDNSSMSIHLKFSQLHYTFQIPERTKIGLPLGQIIASATSTLNHLLLRAMRYRIINDGSNSTFCINEKTGVIYVSKELAFNSIQNNRTIFKYNFAAIASISSTINATAKVTILPAMISQHQIPPQFQKRYYTSYVKEAQPVNTYVTQLSLIRSLLVSYSIINQTINYEDLPFHIDPLTGIIRTSMSLNVRRKHRYTLKIMAQGINQLQDQCVLIIYVKDINNHQPVFINQSYFVGVIQEETPVGSFVYQFNPSTIGTPNLSSRPLHVVATDEDFGQNGNVSYKIVYPLDSSLFQINHNGTIQTRQRLNFENRRSYTLFIMAYDHGTPVRAYSQRPARVIIRILDIHDQAPLFLQNPYQFQLYLPTYASVIVGRVQAQSHGYGAQPLRYSIVTNNHSNFEINTRNGLLTVGTQNHLRNGTYELDIMAYDQIYRTLGKIYIHVLPLVSNLRFHQTVYRTKVMENDTAIQSLVRVTVAGTQIMDHVEYKILNTGEPPLFQLDPWSGVLATTGFRFDRETTPYYIVVVQAKDRRVPPRIAHTFINITIEDKNDNPPRFLHSPYFKVAYRYWAIGHPVIHLQTYDDDHRLNYKQRTLTIVAGNDGYFYLDPQSGILSVMKDLTAAAPVHRLTVRVEDQNRTELFSTTQILIRLTNNSQPLFEYPSYTIDVRESIPIGTVIIHARAQSINNNTLIYKLESNNELNPFSIDSTGLITLEQELDYELLSAYNLIIRATDPATQSLAMATFEIHVIDINDHAPIFLHKIYDISINESLPIGIIVLHVSAIDADDGRNGNITYSIVSSSSSQDKETLLFQLPFDVDPITGTVKLTGPLDYERKKEYEFEIIAQDAGQPQRLSDTTSVLVHILNTDDEAPRFEQMTYNSQVDLKANVGQFLLCVQAHDEDASKVITYNIQYGNFNSTFRLDALTGVLWLNRSLENFRPPFPTYTLIISATDGRLIGQSRVIIQVIQQSEDQIPLFTQNLYRASIKENLPVRTLITTVAVTDQYNLPVEIEYYHILNDYPRELITIDNRNGELRSRKIFDRELPSQQRIQFTLYAKTRSCRIAWTNVEITVLDENDNRPLFALSRFQGLLPVGNGTGVKVVTVKAVDHDIDNNALIRYRIDTSSAKSYFTIGRRSGVIRTLVNIDSIMNFEFTVRATDIADTRLYSTAQVSISMYDQSRAKPMFQHNSYEYRISEEISLKTVITQLKTEFNSNNSRALSYNLANGNWLSTNNLQNFTLISTNGQLITETLLDREKVPIYNLYAEAWAPLQVPALTEIKVTVLDSNDNSPQFTSRAYSICMTEDVPLRYQVIQVKAFDIDLGDNATFHYQFSPPTSDRSQYRKFSIDPQSGWITTTRKFDREQRSHYELRVAAIDHGPVIQRSSYVVVTINVADLDDSPIRFSEPSYQVKVREDASVDSIIFQMKVIDNDTKQYRRNSYFIVQGDRKRYFRLDRESGQLTLRKNIDRTDQMFYWIKIIASSGRHWTSTQLNISVVDITSYTPSCRRSSIKMTLPYHIAVGTLIFTVQPLDVQQQYYNNYTYILYGRSKAFRIDRQRGEIRTLTEFQRDQASYDLIIIATRNPRYNPPSCYIQLHVQFTNIDNKPPKFLSTRYQVSIKSYAPINFPLLQIMAIDSDEGQAGNLTYKLLDSINGTFLLDSETGQLYLGKSLMEHPSYNYTLLAIASDEGEPKMSATTKIIVAVFNVESLLPRFKQESFSSVISEDAVIGTLITNVNANPGYDQHYYYGSILYTIIQQQPQNNPNMFNIDEKTGNVTLYQRLDYENVRDYNVTIKCYYEDDQLLYDTTTLLIHIKDKNDNRPQFPQSSYIVKLHKLTSAGTPIVRLVAYDRDSHENANIRYTIVTKHQDYFKIDTRTGIIILDRVLDRNYRKRYHLIIQAKDNGSPSLASTTALEVIVDEVGAIFEPKRFTAIVYIGTSIGTEILTVKPSNVDFEVNRVYYKCLNTSRVFKLDNTTGLVTLANIIKPKHNHTLLLIDVYHSLTNAFIANVEIFIYVKYNEELIPQAKSISTNIASSQPLVQLGEIGQLQVENPSWYPRLQYELEYIGEDVSVLSAVVIDRYYGNISIVQSLPTGRYQFSVKVISPYQIGTAILNININLISPQALANSIVIRIGSPSIESFLQNGDMRLLRQGLQLIFPQLHVHIIGLQVDSSTTTNDEVRQRRSSHLTETKFLKAVIMVTGTDPTQVINSKYVEYVINNRIDQLNTFTGLNISSMEENKCYNACPVGTMCYIQQAAVNQKSQSRRWFPIKGTTGFISEEYQSVVSCYCDDSTNSYTNCSNINGTIDSTTLLEDENSCNVNSCSENEKCINQSRGHQCLCQIEDQSNNDCRSVGCNSDKCNDDKAVTFTNQSLIRYTLDKLMLYQPLLSLKLKFRTVEENVTLIYIANQLDTLAVMMMHGRIHVICQYNQLVHVIAMNWVTFNDGLWHQLQLLQNGERLILQLDNGMNVASAIVNGAFRIEDMRSGYVLLGTSAMQSTDSPLSTLIKAKNFVGCMEDFVINNNLMSPWSKNTQSSAYMKNIENECLSVDLCQSQPCRSNHSVCVSGWNSYRCECPGGYFGLNCQNGSLLTNSCEQDPCGSRGKCIENATYVGCECYMPYTGEFCEAKIDYCSIYPCYNNATCINTLDRAKCQCLRGYSGRHCGKIIAYQCGNKLCDIKTTCITYTKSPTCICNNVTRNCPLNCADRPCINAISCIDGDRRPNCTCQHGYYGIACERDIDECSSNPCYNNGQCINYPGSFRCKCTSEYEGELCRTPKLRFAPLARSGNMPLDDILGMSLFVATAIVLVCLFIIWRKYKVRFAQKITISHPQSSIATPNEQLSSITDSNKAATRHIKNGRNNHESPVSQQKEKAVHHLNDQVDGNDLKSEIGIINSNTVGKSDIKIIALSKTEEKSIRINVNQVNSGRSSALSCHQQNNNHLSPNSTKDDGVSFFASSEGEGTSWNTSYSATESAECARVRRSKLKGKSTTSSFHGPNIKVNRIPHSHSSNHNKSGEDSSISSASYDSEIANSTFSVRDMMKLRQNRSLEKVKINQQYRHDKHSPLSKINSAPPAQRYSRQLSLDHNLGRSSSPEVNVRHNLHFPLSDTDGGCSSDSSSRAARKAKNVFERKIESALAFRLREVDRRFIFNKQTDEVKIYKDNGPMDGLSSDNSSLSALSFTSSDDENGESIGTNDGGSTDRFTWDYTDMDTEKIAIGYLNVNPCSDV